MMDASTGDVGRIRQSSSQRLSPGQCTRFIKGSNVTKPANFDGNGLVAIFQHPVNVLLVLVPVGAASGFLEWPDSHTFWINFVAMIPLAKILGDATEELAAGLKNDILAGLINATFGNAVEMVITVMTLRRGLFDVVKATLLGSVLSNMLLVLGMSFFLGGLVNNRSAKPKGDRSFFITEKVQTFQSLGALINTSMLLLSCLSFTLVTVFHAMVYDTMSENNREDYMATVLLPISRICSLIVISTYLASLVFQLGTHTQALSELPEGDPDDPEEEANLSVCSACVLLAVTTVVVSFCSELLVRSIEGVTLHSGMGQQFIGIILLPIIGNACEHAAAVRFAIQDKAGLSVGIAVGSSTQVALFVVPFSVCTGWLIGQPMDLNFGALNTAVITLSVVMLLTIVVDGKSNWLQGYLLCAAYGIVCVLYWYLPNDVSISDTN